MGYVVDSYSGWALAVEAGVLLSRPALSKLKSEGFEGVNANDVTAICYDVEQCGGAPAIDVHSDGDFSQAVHHASVEITEGSGQVGFGEWMHVRERTHHLDSCFPRDEANHCTGVDQEGAAGTIGKDDVGGFACSGCQSRAGNSKDAVVVA